MKRKIKKAAVMMAAAVVTLGNGNPRIVHAFDLLLAPVESETVTFPMTETEHAVKVELLGTVDVSLISVTMPSDGFEFRMNPEVPFDARENPGGQTLCPDASILKVENHSVVSIRLEVSEVAKMGDEDTVFSGTFLGGPEQNFRLVDKISAVKDYGSAILMLGRAGIAYENEVDFEQYAIYPGESSIRITNLKVGESTGLQFYGKAMTDFYGECWFAVKPALRISIVRVNQARLA